MNGKLILFSAIVTAGVGAVIGLGVAEMRSDSYPLLDSIAASALTLLSEVKIQI